MIAGASNATPFAALDADRHAVVAYQQNGQLVQTETADAGAVAFGPPVTLSSGQVGGMQGAQAPDGRAAIAWYETQTIPPNQYASTMRFDLYAAVRGPGKPFANVQHVDGSADVEAGYSGNNEVAIAPNGRAIIGYRTRFNRGVSLPCADTIGEAKTVVAVAQIKTDGTGSFAAQVLAGGGNVDGLQPRVAAGTDGRLAASWVQLNGCGNANLASPRRAPRSARRTSRSTGTPWRRPGSSARSPSCPTAASWGSRRPRGRPRPRSPR